MAEQALHENKIHGTLTFPYTIYKTNIPESLMSFPMHWHDEAELIYVRSGTGCITVQTERYTVGEGDVVIILPQTVHAIERDGDARMEYFNILFNFSLLNYSTNDICYEKYFKPLYNHTKLTPSVARAGSELNALLLPHIRYLIDNRKYAENDELRIKAKLFEIMHVLSSAASAASNKDLCLKNNYDKLKNLLIALHSDYNGEMSVETAAKLCAYSPSHFMKIFKDLTGKSFTRYLVDYRLEIAAEQIRLSNDKITDIATSAGFNSMSYFTRAFVKTYGVTPSEYRNRDRSDLYCPHNS